MLRNQCEFENVIGQMHNRRSSNCNADIKEETEHWKHDGAKAKSREECQSRGENNRNSNNDQIHETKVRNVGENEMNTTLI